MRILIVGSRATEGEEHARPAAEALITGGHEVVIASSLGPRWPTVVRALSLLRCILRHRIQVVHAWSPADRVAGWLASRLARVPMVSAGGGDEREIDVPRLEALYRSAYVNGRRREIPILCYHRLVDGDDEGGQFNTHLHVHRFESHLRYLRDHGYRTLHFADLSNSDVFDPRARTVVLTFDDGYEDNYRLLFPLLKKYNVKAVIYLVPGLQRNEWDIAHGEKPLRLLTQAERREMLDSGLAEFGAHTMTHADMAAVSEEQANVEIRQSKQQLEAELGRPVETFAYPYGHVSEHAKRIARCAGFRYALATNSGPVAVHEDPYHVRRIVVFPGITMRRFRRRVSGRYVQRPAGSAV